MQILIFTIRNTILRIRNILLPAKMPKPYTGKETSLRKKWQIKSLWFPGRKNLLKNDNPVAQSRGVVSIYPVFFLLNHIIYFCHSVLK